MKVSTAAKRWQMSRPGVYALIYKGDVKAVKVEGSWVIDDGAERPNKGPAGRHRGQVTIRAQVPPMIGGAWEAWKDKNPQAAQMLHDRYVERLPIDFIAGQFGLPYSVAYNRIRKAAGAWTTAAKEGKVGTVAGDD